MAKALEFDSTLGEAHSTLGFIKAHYERDWSAADRQFEQAIESLTPTTRLRITGTPTLCWRVDCMTVHSWR